MSLYDLKCNMVIGYKSKGDVHMLLMKRLDRLEQFGEVLQELADTIERVSDEACFIDLAHVLVKLSHIYDEDFNAIRGGDSDDV